MSTDRAYNALIGLAFIVAGVVLLALRDRRARLSGKLLRRDPASIPRFYAVGVYVVGPIFLIIVGILALIGVAAGWH